MDGGREEPLMVRKRRRWLQFSLRGLLGLTLLVAAGLGWLRYQILQCQREEEAIRAFRAKGGEVRYEHEFQKSGVRQPPGAAWLRAALGERFFARVRIIYFPPGIGDEALAILDRLRPKQVQSAKMVSAGGTTISEKGRWRLVGIPNLEKLDLRSTSITDTEITRLAALRKLQSLVLRNTAITDGAVDELCRLPSLSGIDVRGTHVTGKGGRKLEELILSKNGPGHHTSLLHALWTPAASEKDRQTAVAIEQLGGGVEAMARDGAGGLSVEIRTDVQSRVGYLVSMPYGQVADDMVSHLQRLNMLQEINIDGTSMSGSQWSRLAELANQGRLKTLRISFVSPGQDGWNAISQLKSLERLGLHDAGDADDYLPCITRLMNLNFLYLYSDQGTDAGLAPIATLNGLRTLELRGANYTDAAMEHIVKLENLEELYVPVSITDAGLACLNRLTRLRRLRLLESRVTDTGMACLRAFPQLESAWLSGTRITDAGLVHLEGLKNLREVGLPTQITDEARERLRSALENLHKGDAEFKVNIF